MKRDVDVVVARGQSVGTMKVTTCTSHVKFFHQLPFIDVIQFRLSFLILVSHNFIGSLVLPN